MANKLKPSLLFFLIVNVDLLWAGQCTLSKTPIYGLPINVTFVVQNVNQPPIFTTTQVLNSIPQSYLISALSTAADFNNAFLTYLTEELNKMLEGKAKPASYSASYYTNYGLMITTMNNLFADPNKNKYWVLLDLLTGQLLPCGASQFVPFNNDVIMLNFTTF